MRERGGGKRRYFLLAGMGLEQSRLPEVVPGAAPAVGYTRCQLGGPFRCYSLCVTFGRTKVIETVEDLSAFFPAPVHCKGMEIALHVFFTVVELCFQHLFCSRFSVGSLRLVFDYLGLPFSALAAIQAQLLNKQFIKTARNPSSYFSARQKILLLLKDCSPTLNWDKT